MIHRLRALIKKEILALVRDPRSRVILIMPPMLQLFVFSFAATLEVRNNSLAIWNEDPGVQATELIQRISGMDAFNEILYVHDGRGLDRAIERQDALLAVHIPPDFSRKLLRGGQTRLQVLVDGRRSNSGQIALGYLAEVLRQFQISMLPVQAPPRSEIITRHWFNPNLKYHWFVVPGLVAILTPLMTMIVTALSLSRERELGTFEQLMVSPLTPAYILAGKAIPAFIVAMAEATFIVTIGVFVFGVPFEGSLVLLYLTMAAYILSLVGIGLFISALCATQQQAILGVFSFVLPAVLLSGFASPVDNMPDWLGQATLINPLRHFLEISKGIFLKDVSGAMIWSHTWPLLLIAAVNISAANWLFRRKFG